MSELTLVVMAAGIGSRFGGIKQIEPVGPNGELIVDYSVYDALQAGFSKIVFVIKPEIEREFRELTVRAAEHVPDVRYAFQTDGDLPRGITRPEGRTKPWGTVHAVMAAEPHIDGPFAAINADDCYGPTAFVKIADWLRSAVPTTGAMRHAAVLYALENALPPVGSVTRGVCDISPSGELLGVHERRGVERTERGGRCPAPDGWIEIPKGTPVSMNFWGLDARFIARARDGWEEFLRGGLARDPMGCEYLLPDMIDAQIRSGEAAVDVKMTDDEWYGVTYREDLPRIREAIAGEHRAGLRPTPLWGDR